MNTSRARVGLSVMLLVTLALIGVGPTSAATRTATSHFLEPLDGVVITHPCTGEEVMLSGTLHYVFHITDNDQGYHVLLFANAQHLGGISASGTQYHGSGGERGRLVIFEDDSSARSRTSQIPFNFISQGTAPNYRMTRNVHFTVNANGVLTVDRIVMSEECYG